MGVWWWRQQANLAFLGCTPHLLFLLSSFAQLQNQRNVLNRKALYEEGARYFLEQLLGNQSIYVPLMTPALDYANIVFINSISIECFFILFISGISPPWI